VKPRRQIIVAKKQKVRRTISLSVKLVIVAAAVSALVINVTHFLLSSSRFAVSHIGVIGNTNVTAQTVIEQSGLAEGRNILKLPIAEAATAIAKIPRVRSAVVRRKLPDEIQIEITERQPSALILAKELLLLDHDKKVIDRFDSTKEKDLPLITGRVLRGASIGDILDSDGIEQALQVIDAMAEPALSNSIRLSEINIDDLENILIITEPFGASVYLGSGAFRDKLWRLAQVTEEIKRNERLRMATLERVDMRFESIIPAKFIGGWSGGASQFH
jgi:cell division protein FtsQ